MSGNVGPPSIWEAIQYCGAERLCHGVRIVDDIERAEDGSFELGRLAAYVRDTRIPLELCPSSNVHTGAAESIETHPIGDLVELGELARLTSSLQGDFSSDPRVQSLIEMTNKARELSGE